ncbi:MAG: alpha-2-macroglobulin family protein, partial [Bacteroidota bacterium]
ALEEVVIVGYGTTQGLGSTYDIDGLVTRSVTSLAARVAPLQVAGVSTSSTVNIRGLRTDATEYYVDGVRVQGELLEQLQSEQISQVKVENDQVYITTKNGFKLADLLADLPPPDLRKNFSDYAAFLPELRTDRNGMAYFDVTFPDDITAWNTYVMGQDRRQRVGFDLQQTTAFLPLQAQLYLPRFLVEGDRSQAATLAINREDAVKQVRLSFSGDGVMEQRQDTLLERSIQQDFSITAIPQRDSLRYQFGVQTVDFTGANSSIAASSDGEARTIPVSPRGSEMVAGSYQNLQRERPFTAADDFIPARGDVHLRFMGNRVQQLMNDLDHIIDYPYACAEQSASRLIGLLYLEKVRAAQGKPFTATSAIRRTLRRLKKLAKPNGGYGWWPDSQEASPWISLQVYRALSMAQKAGYSVSDLSAAQRYLQNERPQLPLREQLDVMLALAEGGILPTVADLTRLDTITEPDDFELLAIAHLHQLKGDTIDVKRLMDSSNVTLDGGRYWGKTGYWFSRQPLRDRVACTLMGQAILHKAGEIEAAQASIQYLLGQTKAAQAGDRLRLGSNTLESARILSVLLPVFLAADDVWQTPSISLSNGEEIVMVDQFPYETVLPVQQLPLISITRSGKGPISVAAYQRWFESAPTATSNGFKLSSQLLDVRDRPLPQLTKGETAYLEVTVSSTGDANYVLLEIPIPAGCSYRNRTESKGPYAVHREYRKDRVAIFFDRLPRGEYTYRVALEPRFAGQYALNPARIEMQYLPVVHGNNGLKEVRIE